MIKQGFTIVALLLVTTASWAQNGDDIRMENVRTTKKENGTINIKMDLVLDKELKVESNRMMTLTPLLKDKEYTKAFNASHVYGRKRLIINERKDRMPEAGSNILRRENGKRQVVSYNVDMPYEPWMDNAEIVLDKDLCGCGNHIEENSQKLMASVDMVPERAVTLSPDKEKVKHRSRAGKGLIQFPVNEMVIYPEYMKNPEELQTIDKNFADIAVEDFLSVSLHGYASPESPVPNNSRLAKGRTEALKDYLIQKYGLKESLFATTYTAEDWDGFMAYLNSCDLKDKKELLRIANLPIDPDIREWRMKSEHKASFEYMRQNWLPSLRHTDYVIEYVAKHFTAQEARIQFRNNPAELSQWEMYEAAQLCEKGSQEYCTIISKAVELYPEDAIANLNAAAMEMERGNLEKAEQYLNKSDMNMPEAKANLKRLKLLKQK